MSYIRENEERTYFEGQSHIYLYPNASTDSSTEGSSIRGNIDGMTEVDLAELALRVIQRTEIDEETFDEVVTEVQDNYPDSIKIPTSAPRIAKEIQEENGDDIPKPDFYELVEVQFENISTEKKQVAWNLYNEETTD